MQETKVMTMALLTHQFIEKLKTYVSKTLFEMTMSLQQYAEQDW